MAIVLGCYVFANAGLVIYHSIIGGGSVVGSDSGATVVATAVLVSLFDIDRRFRFLEQSSGDDNEVADS